MTKYLVKAKKGCSFVSTNGNGEFLDEYRYRVFSNAMDIREWGSRKLIEIYGEVRDDATEEKLQQYLKDGEDGFKKFVEDFAPVSKKVEVPAPIVKEDVVEAEPEPEVIEEPEEIKTSSKKKSKHSKK